MRNGKFHRVNKVSYIIVFIISFFSVALSAKVNVREQTQLLDALNAGIIPQFVPEKQHPEASYRIIKNLLTYHYRKAIIDDNFSEQVFKQFLDRLDANHSYLLSSDIAEFEKYRFELDNALRTSDLTPAYTMFNKFLIRWVERYQFALKRLQQPFDFSIDEDYDYDHTEQPWTSTAEELDERWRKRIKNDLLNLLLADKDTDTAKDLLSKRYKASMRRMAQSNSQDVFWYYMNSVAQSVEPHTHYFSPRAAENFDIRMKLSLEGIGAVLQSEDVYTKIVSLVPKGPAYKTGEVKADDKIIAVGQGEEPLVDIIGWRLDDVVDLIRGKAGTLVRLEVLPKNSGGDAKSKIISITRDKVKLEEQSAKSEIIEIVRNGKTQRFGVIELPTFYIDFEARYKGEVDYKSTTRDVRKLINDLQKEKISGLIIDLRLNGGGSLDEAVDLTGLFIDKGPVVQERSFRNEISIKVDTDPGITYGGPLAVLVDRGSASASEIFAAAIQDYGRGLVIGEQTFGKGTVQVMKNLDNHRSSKKAGMGLLKFTYSKFYRINGESTQHKGVIPDITYPSAFVGDDFGESSQPNALPWDTILPVDYKMVGDISQYLPLLIEAHHNRIATDIEFKYLIEDINEYLKNSDKKSVSLHLVKRKQKRQEREEKLLTRENKRRIEKGLKAISHIDELDDDNEGPDPRLRETAEVLQDFIQLQNGQKIAYVKPRKIVEQSDN